VKVQISVAEFSSIKCLSPRRLKSIAGPWLTERIAQDGAFRLFGSPRIEHDFQRCTDRDDNPLFLFASN
jgi:hypothetical protein